MRSVFQTQPEISHVYLGSKRSMMDRLFSDRNEPFWRSARHMELGPIPAGSFARFVRERFAATGKDVDGDAVSRVLSTTGGHPHATQELCYALWDAGTFDAALDRVLRAEHARFTLVWDQASGVQRLVPGARGRGHDLDHRRRLPAAARSPGSSSVQRALDALTGAELVARDGPGAYRIAEPFLAEWVRRFAA